MLLRMALFHSSMAEISSYVDHVFVIHFSVDGHLGSFHVLAIDDLYNPSIRIQ